MRIFNNKMTTMSLENDATGNLTFIQTMENSPPFATIHLYISDGLKHFRKSAAKGHQESQWITSIYLFYAIFLLCNFYFGFFCKKF